MATNQTAGRPSSRVKRVDSDEDNVTEIVRPGDLDLDAIIAQRSEALGIDDGGELGFTFKGKRYTMQHPLFASDEWQDKFADLDSQTEIGRHCLGDDQYDEFTANGGRAGFVLLVIKAASEKFAASDATGKGTPSSRFSNRTQRRQR